MTAAGAAEQSSDYGHRPAGIEHVIHQQNRTFWDRLFHHKYAIQIATLMKPVLLRLLRLGVSDFPHRRDERQVETLGKPACEISHQFGMIARRHAGHPFGRWLGEPPLAYHVRHRVDEFVAEVVVVLVLGNHLSPASITPARQDPPGSRPEVLCQIAAKAVPEKGILCDLPVALQRCFRASKEAA